MEFELLDEKDGLSSHWLTNMALDSSGFIWLGTRDGLNRYDGHSFKIFRHIEGDSTSLRADYGQAIYVAWDGTVWISYNTGGIGYYDKSCNCFKHIPGLFYENRDMTNHSHVLHVDKRGVLWFGGQGNGFNFYHTQTGEFKHYDLSDIDPGYSERDRKNYNGVASLVASPDGLFWCTSLNGLYSFDPRTEEMKYHRYGPMGPGIPRNDGFNSILLDGDKGLWLGTWGGGVCYYSFAENTFHTYKYVDIGPFEGFANIVTDIAFKDNDELWVATIDKSLLTFNIQTKQFAHLSEGQVPEFLENASGVFGIVKTASGEFFMSADLGLFKYSPYKSLFRFKTLPITKSQNGDMFRILSVIEDEEYHAIYFGLHLGNGLNVLDTKTGKLEAFKVDVPADKGNTLMLVNAMNIDNQGRMWVFSDDYLYEFDRRKRQLIKKDIRWAGEERGHFYGMYINKEGEIWVTTSEGGLYRFDPQAQSLGPRVNTGEHEEPTFIRDVLFDEMGRIWFTTGEDVWAYDPGNGQFASMLSPEFIEEAKKGICGLTIDAQGDIWAAVTTKGVFRISLANPMKPTFEWVFTEKELPSLKFHEMSSDPFGNLWISHVSGVIYCQTATRKVRNFSYMSGMDKNTIWMKFVKGYKNEFYITTPKKYCRVDFERLGKITASPKVYLDRFSVMNKERIGALSGVEEVRLAANENFFSFDFGCLDFADQSLFQFAYMLEGWDKDWVNCGTRRFANYTNLNGGNYVFKVKVANSEGVWGEPVSINVFIATPFYKKTWFLLLVSVLFAALLYGLYLYRVSQIEQTERMKTEFNRQLSESRMQALRAQMNPHFIFNSLNSINRYIIKNDIKTSSLYLTRFAKLIRLILDNSANKKVALSRELEALTLYIDIEALRFDNKFTYKVSVAPDVDAPNIEVPPLIIQPYVENAIWHGLLHKESGGELLIHVTKGDDCIVCEVTDNGIGRVKAQEYKSSNAPTRQSIGMKLTAERLQLQSSAEVRTDSVQIIDLYDAEGNAAGTTVTIKIFF